MKRVLLYAAPSLAAGILLQSIKSVEAAIALSVGFIIFLVYCLLKGKHTAVVLCTVAAAAGFLYMGLYSGRLEKKIDFYEGRQAYVSGRVVNVYESENYFSADIKTDKLALDGKDINDKIKIRVYFYEEPDIQYGDIIGLSVNFNKYSDFIKNISQSNGALAAGSASTGTITKYGSKISKLNPADDAYMLRNFVGNRIDAYLDGDAEGLLLGILTGNTSKLSESFKENLRKCSLSHVTAVSGMHLGIVLMLAMSVFSVFRLKRHKAAVICYVAVIWFFAMFSGLGASVTRAALMTTLMFAAYLLKRDSDALTSLAAAAVFMLLLNPAAIYDLGFELSVAATAGIIVFQPLIQAKIKPFAGFLAEIISVTVAAQLATLPLIVYYFAYISVFGIIANITVTPFLPVIMGLGIIFLMLSGIAPAAVVLSETLSCVLTVLIYIVRFISNVPLAAVAVRFSPLWVCAYVCFTAALYFLLRKKRRYALHLAALSAAFFMIFAATSYLGEDAHLSFVSVGRGDCTVFKTADAVIMFDSGGDMERNIGREKVLPYLRRAGISKVDIAFITHLHIDHAKGLIPLLNDGMIKYLVLPSEGGNEELREEVKKAAALGGTKVYDLSADKNFSFCGIEVCAVNTANGGDENNGFVYFLTYGENRALITGDINKAAERKLCEREDFKACNILKVSHHGSKTSSDSTFLHACGAKLAVISCSGVKLPADETVDAIKNENMIFATTKANGNIEFVLDRKRFKKVRLERGSVNEL